MSVGRYRPGRRIAGERRALILTGFFAGESGLVPVTILNTRALVERLGQ